MTMSDDDHELGRKLTEAGMPFKVRRGVIVVEGITCPRCGLTSYHPKDISEGYCGNCHDWTGRLHGRWARGGVR
jgi:hypothetical protein